MTIKKYNISTEDAMAFIPPIYPSAIEKYPIVGNIMNGNNVIKTKGAVIINK